VIKTCEADPTNISTPEMEKGFPWFQLFSRKKQYQQLTEFGLINPKLYARPPAIKSLMDILSDKKIGLELTVSLFLPHEIIPETDPISISAQP